MCFPTPKRLGGDVFSLIMIDKGDKTLGEKVSSWLNYIAYRYDSKMNWKSTIIMNLLHYITNYKYDYKKYNY